jgi:hypothetical protein
MSRTTAPLHRRVLVTGTAAFALIAVSACGSDDLAERGLEELAEREGAGDVDIDLDSGEFSVETEDGSMTMDEDGNFVITDESGEVVVGDVDDDGNLTVESEDGSFTSGGGTDFPDEWPDAVPRPDDIEIFSSAAMREGGSESVIVTAEVDGDFADRYRAQLEDAGFEVESEFSQQGAQQVQMTNGDIIVSFGVFSDDTSSQATISVITETG